VSEAVVRLVGGPYNGLSYEFPDGAIRDPGTAIFLPFSYASDPHGLAYVRYQFTDNPAEAHFTDWVDLDFRPKD
jgi:hypothetical protein